MRANRRTPKVFYSPYSQNQRQSLAPTRSPGQLKQLFIVGVIIIGGYFLTRLPVFQVRTIVLAGSNNPELTIQLDGLKGSSILSGAIAERVAQIERHYPELEMLECIKGIPNTLRCQATERQPQLAWQTGGHMYLLDGGGVAYQITEAPNVPIVEDRKNVAVKLGDQPINGEILSIYRDIQTKLTESGYTVGRFFVNTSVLHAGAVLTSRAAGSPFPANPIEVELSLSYPVSIQVVMLNQLLETKSSQISNRVDLRTPGYLYYK